MKFSVRLLVGLLCVLYAAQAFAAQPPWPKIDKALAAWQGEKELLLVTAEQNPLESPTVQEILEQVLIRGFAVRTSDKVVTSGKGLVLELRDGNGGGTAFLRRGSDSAIIAFERHTVVVSAPPAAAAPAPVPAMLPPQQATESSPVTVQATRTVSSLPGPLPLPGSPRSLAVLTDTPDEGLDIALQSDAGVERFRLRDNLLQPLGSYTVDHRSMRALYLEAGDPDKDGETELAAVWADDTRGIYAGTDSQPQSTIFEVAGRGFAALSGPRAFIRLTGDFGVAQYRDRYALVQGPVLPLQFTGETWQTGTEAVAWAGGNLFETTPINAGAALQWTADKHLRLVSLQNGTPVAGGTLLYDLGEFEGARIAVPLENPEYRSGFSKEDMVRETWVTLPPRIVVDTDGTAYTIRRERSTGLPLIGKPSGHDNLVALRWTGDRFTVSELFPGVEAFIIDFALVKRQGRVDAALLLLNKKPDAGGEAYLQLVPFAR